MKRNTAVVMFRPALHYRKDAFCAGLEKIGYNVVSVPPRVPNRGDVVVLWNRMAQHEAIARNYERNKAIVLVAENGYVGKAEDGSGLFALSKWQHNGAGEWRVGDKGRWSKFRVELAPWREDGEFLLVLPQRGIGSLVAAMPLSWPKRAIDALRVRTKREIKVRPHPGNSSAQPNESFKGAWAMVTWGSGAAIKALAAGYPVFHEMKHWIGAPAARHLKTSLEEPFLGDRRPMFERLAWAQWTPTEIQNGEAFAWLLK